MAEDTDADLELEAADGWLIGGLLRAAAGSRDRLAPAALLVPGSRHERDAYVTLAGALAERGVASLRIDIRGRGASTGGRPYARMAPRQRERVALDAVAALDALAGATGVDPHRLGLVAEQDTAADAVRGIGSDARLRAVVLLSARHGRPLTEATVGRAVFGLVSKEDREGLRGTADGYLAGVPGASRLEVFAGLGFGTTMFSTRQFEHPDAEPLEAMIADWLADHLG